MNLFVTGSNGYIGRNFINKAAKKNIKIFAVTRKKKNKKIKNLSIYGTGNASKKILRYLETHQINSKIIHKKLVY